MVKTRFSAADVRAIVRDLRGRVLGMRVVNVYDIDSKTYLIKLAEPGKPEKIILLLESGIRFHSTRFDRDKADMPSGFAMKLRRHIRSKRLEDVTQLGIDRVVDFRFGSGENTNHIILEMYAGGNIILTDEKYEILSLLRIHKFEENVSTAVKEIYPIEHATTLINDEEDCFQNNIELYQWIKQQIIKNDIENEKNEKIKLDKEKETGQAVKKTRMKKMTLKIVLGQRGSGVSMYGADIIGHCILQAGLDPNTKVSLNSDGELSVSLEACSALLEAFPEAKKVYQALDTPGQPGYIYCNGEVQNSEGVMVPKFDDALPYVLNQHKDKVTIEYPSYDQAIDEYFAKFEEQRLAISADNAEHAIKARVEKIKQDQEARISTLEEQEAIAMRRAELLEIRADDVDKALTVLRSALSCGVGWDELMDYITAQQEAGNQIAMLIHALRLDTSTVVVLLEDDDEEGDAPALAIELDINQSAHANARIMFAKMKSAKLKKTKTEEAAARVVEVAEKQSQDALSKHYQKRQLKAVRKIYWFEKFNWFITSENYLVLGGRDAQQNDTIVKKYLRPGDAYVHADLHGAASCVVRNKDPKGLAPLSDIALHEAGCFTVCRSAAWKSKMFASAWWVHANQVSKTAPTGEYLSTGSFMIRGKKNFLPPTPLEMGLALLFKLDDDSVWRHSEERKEKNKDDDEQRNDNQGGDGGGGGGVSSSLSAGRSMGGSAALVSPDGVINTGKEKVSKNNGNDKSTNKDKANKEKDLKEKIAQQQSSSSSSSQQKHRLTKKQQQLQRREAEEKLNNNNNNDEDKDVVEGSEKEVTSSLEELSLTSEEAPSQVTPEPVFKEKEEEEATIPSSSSSHPETNSLEATNNEKSSSFITPRERRLMKKKGWSIEKVREEDLIKKKEEEMKLLLKKQEEANNKAKDNEEGEEVEEEEDDNKNTTKSSKSSKKSKNTTDSVVSNNEKKTKPNEVSASKQAARAEMLRGKKGKARKIKKKYKENDDEDLLLHRIAVGHAQLVESDDENEDNTEKAAERSKAEKTISLVLGDIAKAMSELPQVTQDRMRTLRDQALLRDGDIDIFELKMLKSLNPEQQAETFRCFEGADLKKIANKSGLMSGIMRRIAQEERKKKEAEEEEEKKKNINENDDDVKEEDSFKDNGEGAAGGVEDNVEEEGGETGESARARKRRMEAEMKKLLEEEGIGGGGGGEEGDGGSYVAELNKLTGLPNSSEDTLLFAVPVCAPYSSISKYKYKVKLTPGEGKKGRTGKQAVEVFARNKECSPREKDLIKMMSDNEVVQCMIGDVKMSTPGLHAAHNAKRSAKKAHKNKSTK